MSACGDDLMNPDTPEEYHALGIIDPINTHRGRPQLVFASAIDSPALEIPEKQVCIMNDNKPGYVRPPEGAKELYPKYGPESLESWHKKNGCFVE
ncbi:hypothetical protein K438DRAFT_1801137 [Mycena galopus ATCC 62051]|nr:hypothetical protein K438DRAFT_1801137 [Mycena galopus ATCC 62051]